MKKQIAILGFGKEGQALAKYFTYKTIDEVVILDEKLEDLPVAFEQLELQNDLIIPKVDIAFKSPGIAMSKIQNPHNVEISSLITLLFQKLDMSKVIAVTGTKGKSTTASLIHHILISNNVKAELLGNIGNINIDLLDNFDPETYYIFELSSYQCEMLQNSPRIAIWTSFYIDHQDVHASMEEYYNAKARITKFQTKNDFLIVGSQVDVNFKTKAKLIVSVPTQQYETKLQGEHNQNNCEFAFQACSKVGLNSGQILSAIRTYEPLRGRLEMVGEYNDVKFFADDLATIPEATWAAIQSFDSSVLDTVIVGGYDKGSDYTQLAKDLVDTKIKNYICFEPMGSKIVAELDRAKVNIMTAKNMYKAVELAYKLTKKEGVCLMSPGAASFGMFENAYDRGEQFRKYVKQLGGK
jgi:UDP-N-acetylmuramoyl-L-alanine---L-glutamate ligase